MHRSLTEADPACQGDQTKIGETAMCYLARGFDGGLDFVVDEVGVGASACSLDSLLLRDGEDML